MSEADEVRNYLAGISNADLDRLMKIKADLPPSKWGPVLEELPMPAASYYATPAIVQPSTFQPSPGFLNIAARGEAPIAAPGQEGIMATWSEQRQAMAAIDLASMQNIPSQEPTIAEASLLPAAAAAWLVAAGKTALVAGAGAVLSQIFEGGEGGGEVPTTTQMTSNGFVDLPGRWDIPLVGPGVKEPPTYMVRKQVSTQYGEFYYLTNGWVLFWNRRTKGYKAWKPQKMIVLSKNPRLGTLIKAAKRVDNTMMRFDRRLSKFRSRVRVKPRRRR